MESINNNLTFKNIYLDDLMLKLNGMPIDSIETTEYIKKLPSIYSILFPKGYVRRCAKSIDVLFPKVIKRYVAQRTSFTEARDKLNLKIAKARDETQIEVSIQKQQYASGVQPMVYFCIPLKAFKNSSDLYGKSSVSGDKLVYVVSKANVFNLASMMKVFGMASKRHDHDVVKILETLLEIIGR